jgi:hypothetical protein
MSIEKIHLQKLLRLFYAKPNLQTRLLREDIRSELKKGQKKEQGEKKDGGDFYVAFWADAKNHVAGKLNLREQSKKRIEKSEQRKRLYPLLTSGFLSVWDEKVRWRNEPFEFHPKTAKGQLPLKELGTLVKIENVLSVRVWDGSDRAVYPYFFEEPILSLEGVRLGFWALQEALSEFRVEDLRIMDVLRGAYFRPEDVPLQGNERGVFIQKYDAVLTQWRKLRREYP